MNKILLSLLILTSNKVCAELPSEGIATYKQSVNIHASIPKSQAAMKAFIPEFQYFEIKVSFKDNMLRFKSEPFKDDSEAASHNNNVQIHMDGTSEEIVLDTTSKQVAQYGSLMNIDYYFLQQIGKEDNIVKVDEEQTINGYLCKKAVNNEDDTVIWYHENPQQIVPRLGIPTTLGLIVKVVGKQLSYDLLSIKEQSIEKDYFDIPKHHQKISFEQFEDLKEESMEEMVEKMGSKVMRSEIKH